MKVFNIGDEVICVKRGNNWYKIGDKHIISSKGFEDEDKDWVYNIEGEHKGVWIVAKHFELYKSKEGYYFHPEEHVAVEEGSKEKVNEALGIDRGSHYRYSFRLNLTEEDKENGFVMVNIDPYRISEVYKLGGWREHLFKKTIRGMDKGHTEEELIEELQCTINRAKQMFEESKE